jgi:hypothetical protein
MKFTTRRLAMLACSIALNAVFIFSPPATATVGAIACRQDCDNSVSECKSWCDQDFEVNSEDWENCQTDCTEYWDQFCFNYSTWCNDWCENNGQYYYCWRVGETQVQCSGTFYWCHGG